MFKKKHQLLVDDFGWGLSPSGQCASCFNDGCTHYECKCKIDGRTYYVHIQKRPDEMLGYQIPAYHMDKDDIIDQQITANFSNEASAAWYLYKCFDFRCD